MDIKENSRLGNRVVIPALITKAPKAAVTLHDNSFPVKGGKLWNMLPKSLNQCKELDTFKCLLGKYLDNIPDQPPVRGYSTTNRNSIIDWHNQKGELQNAC